jgi:hypothetical protein
MDIKNEGNTAAQLMCKFLVTETIQGIAHKFCQNKNILAINKCEDGKRLPCMDIIKCGQASFDE